MNREYEEDLLEQKKRKEREEKNDRLNEQEEFVQKQIRSVENKRRYTRFSPDRVEIRTKNLGDLFPLRSATTNAFVENDGSLSIIKATEIRTPVLIGCIRIELIPDTEKLIFADPFDEFRLRELFSGNDRYLDRLMLYHRKMFRDIRKRAGTRGYDTVVIRRIIYRIHEKYGTFNILMEWDCVRNIEEIDHIPVWILKQRDYQRDYTVSVSPERFRRIVITDKNEKRYVISADRIFSIRMCCHPDTEEDMTYRTDIVFRNESPAQNEEEMDRIIKIGFVTVNDDILNFEADLLIETETKRGSRRKKRQNSQMRSISLSLKPMNDRIEKNRIK